MGNKCCWWLPCGKEGRQKAALETAETGLDKYKDHQNVKIQQNQTKAEEFARKAVQCKLSGNMADARYNMHLYRKHRAKVDKCQKQRLMADKLMERFDDIREVKDRTSVTDEVWFALHTNTGRSLQTKISDVTTNLQNALDSFATVNNEFIHPIEDGKEITSDVTDEDLDKELMALEGRFKSNPNTPALNNFAQEQVSPSVQFTPSAGSAEHAITVEQQQHRMVQSPDSAGSITVGSSGTRKRTVPFQTTTGVTASNNVYVSSPRPLHDINLGSTHKSASLFVSAQPATPDERVPLIST